eukprot:TRINITY_DN60680_c0_g1_i1.p1 TRINITY_DN60680_c0_g1~~TRINITY_DN60680_c0_g1_i1.p1  ORF type:complete len:187 (-),score=21.24 TRINITY_DN60680_c0_g1_i1:82-609(-)
MAAVTRSVVLAYLIFSSAYALSTPHAESVSVDSTGVASKLDQGNFARHMRSEKAPISHQFTKDEQDSSWWKTGQGQTETPCETACPGRFEAIVNGGDKVQITIETQNCVAKVTYGSKVYQGTVAGGGTAETGLFTGSLTVDFGAEGGSRTGVCVDSEIRWPVPNVAGNNVHWKRV